jgi:sulfite exporter TauE/SafE
MRIYLCFQNPEGEIIMFAKNVGSVDRVARIVLGVLLLAFALGLVAPGTGWNWLGWIGVVPILTAAFSTCPLYSILGMSTCPMEQRN